MQLYHGDIVYSENKEKLTVRENAYIAVDDGVIRGIFDEIPEKYAGVQVTDHKRGLIIPAFSDLHVHAPQYPQRGIAMDELLSDWLGKYTFPLEAEYKDPEFAKTVYKAFVEDMVKNGTFHATVFGTIHVPATKILFDLMEKAGMDGYVGKVGMDVNSPDFLCETAEESIRDCEEFLEMTSGRGKVKPVLTPRFAPTCSRELLYGYGRLAAKYECGLHTHLVESLWEKAEALRLFPDCTCDAQIYEKAGLLGYGPSFFAHVIFPSDEDMRIMDRYGSFAVHCPDATTNVIAGIMPAEMMSDKGLKIGIGSDIAAGHHVAIYKQVARTVQLSKLKEFYEPEVSQAVSFDRAFYMATKEGGAAFGKTGTFETGYLFDALVIDGLEDPWQQLTPSQRLERFCYAGDDRNIICRYMAGRTI